MPNEPIVMIIQSFKTIFAICFCLAVVSSVSAQKTIRIFELNATPKIDGIHESDLWAGAEKATDFIQMEPFSGEKASSKTEIYVGYDDQNIFISAIMYQETPVKASIQNRDNLSKSDDAMVVLLDSYNDKRTGYGFWINPLGTQADFRINDDGRNLDVNWDTEWNSAAQVQSDGWVAEMRIPFSSIQYDRNISVWGVNFGRIIRENFENVWWSGKMSDDFRLSQGGNLEGVKVPESKAKLTLFPYATLQTEYNRRDDKVSAIPDAGADMKWQVNPNITVDATLNPDFATVEADQELVNLTRYELSYPEKRLFFQEGNEMYDTRIRTFYSRRIQDIFYGAKTTGKAGKYNFNVLNTGSFETEDDPASFFTTARVKRDFLESSTIGFTAVDKRTDSSSVSSFSGDYMLNLGKNWKLTGQIVASLPGDFASHSAWFTRFAHESNKHHVHFRYTEIGENFQENVNQTGIISDDDRREIDSDLSYRWWFENDIFRYIHISSKNNFFWSRVTGDLRSWYLTDGFRIYLRNKLSFEYFYNNEYKLFEKDYYNHRHMFYIGYNSDEWSHVELQYSKGHNFDRDFQRLEVEGQVKLTKKMALAYEADVISFSPDTANYSTFINVLNLNYNFTRDLWVEVFAQTRSNTEKLYLYGKLGWRFRPPFGALYLIYSHDQELLLTDRIDSDAFFVKLTLPISLLSGRR